MAANTFLGLGGNLAFLGNNNAFSGNNTLFREQEFKGRRDHLIRTKVT